MLIQVPIYSGLYLALNMVLNASSVDTINNVMYPFLVHFISRPNANLLWFTIINASWHISLGLPDPSHLLPLLVGLVTFMQMRMAQPIPSLIETKDTLTHISQNTQFLLLLIPVAITIIIAWQFAAGLALYRFVSLMLGILQQYLTTGWGSLWVVPTFEPKSAVVSQPEHQLILASRVSRTGKRHSRRSPRQRRKHPEKKR
jgi:YidC/Oxa1 family membrane protein insertase